MTDPWADIDWDGLSRVRKGYLEQPGKTASLADYWQSERLLRSYEATFAERIGWKWAAVLDELARRGFAPPPGAHLYDWGCGTGIATRACIDAWGPDAVTCAHFWDRSPKARDYATRRLREVAPSVATAAWTPGAFPGRPAVLLISHVLTELDESTRNALVEQAATADVLLWVEPGMYETSRALIAVRERLRLSHAIVAPCTHAARCGLLTQENERHWCHNFAKAPSSVFQDARWRAFSERMGIDLRSLPVSYLVTRKIPSVVERAPTARVLGRAREYKGHMKALVCDDSGVAERVVQKRDDKALFKYLGKQPFDPLLPLDSGS